MEKICDVIMLPAKGKTAYSKLWLMHNKSQGLMHLYSATELDGIGQHFYILSDDEIKEGDWVFGMDGIFQYQGKVNIPDVELPKKIIATTDTSLKINSIIGQMSDGSSAYSYHSLPQLSQRFIKKYIEQYNKGKVITKIKVKYEQLQYMGEKGEYFTQLKLNPEDSTIYIKLLKERWTKKEIMNAIHKVELKHNKNYSMLWNEIEKNL